MQNASDLYFDICISTDWSYDDDFLLIIKEEANTKNLAIYFVNTNNLNEACHLLRQNKIRFGYYFDRASDSSPEFIQLNKLIEARNIPVFQSLDEMHWASDKATMHLEFISKGLTTPYTIILPPYKSVEKIHLTVSDLARLGRPFVIKPANTTGGGIGVVEGAESLQDVLETRRQYSHDKYLIQEKVIPMQLDDKRFWFRGFYICGNTFLAWWDDLTHRFTCIDVEEIDRYQLHQLHTIMEKIAGICRLKFFSTEIALTINRQFVIVDYVNESCDMRLQSQHFDGVPDSIVIEIARQLVGYIDHKIKIIHQNVQE